MPAPSAARQVDRSTVSAIIPCLDEETAIGPCVAAVLAHGLGEVIVVDGGSTDFTVERASQAGGPVTFIATGEALDDEMTSRIGRHKRERPQAWRTIEEPHAFVGHRGGGENQKHENEQLLHEASQVVPFISAITFATSM